jgi:nicotinate phosphoribosyltransferase
MIIESLLDLDLYKLTMMQVAYFKHRDIEVEYTFKNRSTDVNLLEHVKLKDLERELYHVTTLKVTDKEIEYLRTLGFFKEEFLEYLSGLQLPMVKVNRMVPFQAYNISAKGIWCENILWETIILSITNELYHKSQWDGTFGMVEDIHNEGMDRLYQKIEKLQGGRYNFTEFGTRRRYSRMWQERVVKILQHEHNNSPTGIGFQGTSNVHLAMKLGLPCIGTFAHEMPMVYSGIYNDDLKESHRRMLQDWWDFYGETLSIALTDTYGSEYFFNDFTKEQAQNWKGLRQDSGDPFIFGEQAEAFYISKMVDPREKLIVFSDGLNMDKIIDLGDSFRGRIQTGFGWGTNLTNDLGFRTLSLVVKATWSNGHGTVKLSDNLNKAMGSPENIERFKNEFGYTNTLTQELVN